MDQRIGLGKLGGGRSSIALMALMVLLVVPSSAALRGREKGVEVVVTGTVTDAAGLPVEGLEIRLTGVRRKLDLRRWQRTERHPRTVSSTTNDSGLYEIRWSWHPYYNHFRLEAGVAVGQPGGGNDFHALHRRDLTKRLRGSGPVVVPIEIEDRRFFDDFQRFLAEVTSEDERRVYQEAGKPDKVRRAESSNSVETSWWYFEMGKVYRFRNGTLTTVDEFEPVPPFSD